MGQILRIPFQGGSYLARAKIAECQRSVNLYPEFNPQGSSAPVTLYPTPGLVRRAVAPSAVAGIGWRGLFQATTGQVFGVCGDRFYGINSDFTLVEYGSVVLRNAPVRMADNGSVLFVVDGTTTNGWELNTLAAPVFGPIVDPNYLGGTTVLTLDTFLILNQPGTIFAYSTLSNTDAFDPTYIAGKAAYPDLLQAVATAHRELLLLGTYKGEFWYNAGTSGFPFALNPSAYCDHGTPAPYSVCCHDNKIFFLSQDPDGTAMVLMLDGYDVRRISNHGLEYALAQYSRLDDARAFIYQQEGHIFFVLTFPTADATWVFDLQVWLKAPEWAWHERSWTDGNGREHRIRAGAICSGLGKILVGDWENGNLYTYDLNTYTDNGSPIVRRRTYAHLETKGLRVTHGSFQADMEPGYGQGDNSAPTVYLRYSNDRGFSFSNPMEQSLGSEGQFLVRPTWNQLGYAVDRVYEMFWSSNTRTALQGGFALANPNDPNTGRLARMLAQEGLR